MIITGCVAVALASGHGTPVAGQLTDREACGLEQRMGPWRAACHAPIQFSTAVAASPGTARSRLSGAAALSVFGRSRFPIDRDNGAVWAGKGLSAQFAVGIGGAVGPLRYGVYPTIHWAQNADFAVGDFGVADHSRYVYGRPLIDWPQRMGPSADGHMGPGQSYLEVTGWWRAAVGVSTENIWWGPSKRYPMLLGTTSAGFPHVYARSPTLELGAFRMFGRVLSGRLLESEYFDHDSNNDRNLLSALRLEIGLRSLPGTQLAITSMIRQQWAPDFSFGSLIRKLTPLSSAQSGEAEGATDGIGAITLVLPASSLGIQLHGTWGRGDFFLDAEDLLTEPDHNQFWSIGLHREWQPVGDRSRWGFSMEHASTAATPPQFHVRNESFSWGVYRHGGSPQGHTHRGQLLGASIGPGARATYFSIDRTKDRLLLGVLLERVLWDIDVYSRDFRSTFPGGQDRETLIAARLGIDLGVSGVARWRLDVLGGFSLRRNRQYARFTEGLLDHPERETNYWLDLRLAWTPDRANEK
jgi:hypothetical protein